MKHFRFNGKHVIVVVSVVLLIVSMWHWIVLPIYSPHGRMLLPIHNSFDYWLYTSFIRQGLEGNLTTHNLFAIEPHRGGIMYWSYLGLGLVGRLVLQQNAHIVYHVSRVLLGVGWMWILYWFIGHVVKDRFTRNVAYLSALFSASWPIVHLDTTPARVTWFMDWWSEFDPIKRATFLPHYLIGHILMCVALVGFLRSIRSSSLIVFVGTVVVGWFAGFVHPPSLMILMLVLPVWSALQRKPVWFVKSAVFSVVSATSLLLLNYNSQLYPWSVGRGYESLSFYVPVTEYLLALGPVLPLGILGAVRARKEKTTLLLVLWVAISAFMIWFSWWQFSLPDHLRFWKMFPISNIRFLQTAPWIPLAILSGVALRWLRQKLNVHVFGVFVSVLVIVTFIGYAHAFTQPYWKYFSGTDEFSAPKPGWFAAARELDAGEGGIMSLKFAGEILPSLTGRRVLVGHEVMTPNYDIRAGGAYRFFQGTTEVCAAYTLLAESGITHVFYGFDEKMAGNAVESYPFLEAARDTEDVTIYQVKDEFSCTL